MVELVLAEVEPAYQRTYGSRARVHRDECPFDFRLLGEDPVSLGALHGADDGAATDLRLGAGLL